MRYGRQGRVLLPPRRAHPGFRRIQPLRPIGRTDQNKEHLVGGDRLRREAAERSPIRPAPSRAGIPSPTTPAGKGYPRPAAGVPHATETRGVPRWAGRALAELASGIALCEERAAAAGLPGPDAAAHICAVSRTWALRCAPELSSDAPPLPGDVQNSSALAPRPSPRPRGGGGSRGLARPTPSTERSWAWLRPQAVPTGYQRGHRRSLLS